MKRIGVTTHIEKLHNMHEHAVNIAYIKAVIQSEGLPILIPVTINHMMLDDYLNLIDGLVITGGGDVDPLLYKDENHGLSMNISGIRDEMELYLIRQSIKRKIPILGICRGMQLLNVYYGGDLYQDIMTQYDTDIDHINMEVEVDYLAHDVTFEEDSIIGKMMCKSSLKVNSRHHQSVKNLGMGLRITARSQDGIVEAIEHQSDDVIGIQWHPEDLVGLCMCHKKLFTSFIDHCDARSK
ncbi:MULTISPECIES: gamma-glutamyl-gamma-aminobutyrate hydrolase family protein [unclassified Fusibacter]|uniref:gamma-glutamyl-gamma-aminobutyrate hydrolase family protein n=1 Tax=unclassified Fusibacter TaxID=2624464 RepID=UPI001012E59C|nr:MULTISPECIES: gamma-glutamyl-gamma-aminobutyrate hydrolase family protein [unclassified Fusibacter]MCK8058739.1 gamma-glutamyl-gamma-aminobutyrate hydrolase family protein [Fusibacter sp. A2]NPE21813.1 gamma-glutamyl-gamma-aminobutyrate hydrolase family protein [Fusibacter sp. A1]RXV61385.1 gamma-glutamyl-gamma-aminobutyrate hydrolase family protein [Fusibacter sp. A1]